MMNVERREVGGRERGELPDFKMEMLALMGRYLSPIIIPMAKGHLDVN